jgi:hypothetical protein
VYGGHGQNEWEASGSAFSSLREKKHGAQLNHDHAQKRDVPSRPLNFSLFRFFCFKTKEMKSLPGLRAKRILLTLPFAGGTSFFSTAEKGKHPDNYREPWLSKNSFVLLQSPRWR